MRLLLWFLNWLLRGEYETIDTDPDPLTRHATRWSGLEMFPTHNDWRADDSDTRAHGDLLYFRGLQQWILDDLHDLSHGERVAALRSALAGLDAMWVELAAFEPLEEAA